MEPGIGSKQNQITERGTGNSLFPFLQFYKQLNKMKKASMAITYKTPKKRKSTTPDMYTKTERDSALIHIQVTYRHATVRKRIVSADHKIKINAMTTRDFNTLVKLIKKY